MKTKKMVAAGIPPDHWLNLSLAPVASGFALFAADFTPAPWLGHAGVSFQGLLRPLN